MHANSWHDGIPDEFRDAPTESDDWLLRQANTSTSRQRIPLADQAAVEMEADKWARLWRADQEYSSPPIEDADQLQSLTSWGIKQAAFSFPAGTGLGADNISPRALVRLSDVAIAAGVA